MEAGRLIAWMKKPGDRIERGEIIAEIDTHKGLIEIECFGAGVVETGLAQLAIEKGGHVRVGLEDYAGPRTPSNPELVAEVVALARAAGRPVADSAAVARLLDLPATRVPVAAA